MPDVGEVIFPAGAFATPQLVTMSITNTPQTQEGRVTWDVSVGPPATPLPYDVRINTGSVMPTRGFEAVLRVPDTYLSALPPNHTPQVFAQIVGSGAQENLDLYRKLPSVFDPTTKLVRAQVPLRAIGPPRVDDGTIAAILLVGSSPARGAN